MAESEEKRNDGASDDAEARTEQHASQPAGEQTTPPGGKSGGVGRSGSADDDSPHTASESLPEDELPEEEELTPELVEEEAIRGDFMLRWAAIFLAVLFGFTQISDTRPLVHIRSGDAIRANGFLPSGADTLSYALEERDIANVSWLFDVLISIVHGMGGETALTVFKALMAGLIAWLLSRISVPGLPTWWSSICAVLAVAACSIDFMPVTDLATLTGLTLLLWLLHRYRQGQQSGLLWKLGLVMVLWANMDPRAYLGVLLLALFAVGTQLQRAASQKDGTSAPSVGPLWQATAVSILALLIHPAPLASVTSVLTTYNVEHTTMAQMRPLTDSSGATLPPAVLLDGRTEYFPLWSPPLYDGFEFAYVAALTLLVLAVVVLLLNRSREDLPWMMPLLGFTLLAAMAVHELPAAALVAAVAAGTAAQRWYRRSFRQEYSIRTAEVLFSRGGRAVTVLGFAVLAFFVVADRLPTRAPIGIGFEADLATTIDSIGNQLEQLPEDARVLNTVMSQGDILIWHGFDSYVDSRAALFGRAGDELSAIRSFDRLRWSLIEPTDPASAAGGAAEAGAAAADGTASAGNDARPPYDPDWKNRLNELGVTHTMIRMAPPGRPAYGMARKLFQTPDWTLTQRGPSALFFALNTEGRETPEPVTTHELAFRRKSEVEDVQQIEFAREPDFYQKYIYASRRTLPAPLREAQHFLEIDGQADERAVFQIASAAAQNPDQSEFDYYSVLGSALAGPLMAIRRANESILADPNNAMAHRILGVAYLRLHSTEQAIASGLGGSNLAGIRILQGIMAFREAVKIQPDDSFSWNELFELHRTQGRHGLALECLNRFLELEEEQLLADPDAEERLRQLYDYRTQWTKALEEVRAQVAEALDQELPEDPQQQAEQKFALVSELYSQGLFRIALNVINDNLDLLRQLPQTDVIRGQILLESGELEDGYKVLNQLAAFIAENQQNPAFAQVRWHTPVAMSRLAKADYAGASNAWGEQVKIFDLIDSSPQVSKQLMQALPLVAAVESSIGGRFPAWPLMNIQSASMPLNVASSSRYEPEFLRAIANIEAGNLANAKFILEGLISDGGVHPLRPLAEVYYHQLSDEARSVIRETTVDPWQEFEFPQADEKSSGEPDSDTPSESKPADGESSDDAAASATDGKSGQDASAKEDGADQNAPGTDTPPTSDESASADDSDDPVETDSTAQPESEPSAAD